MKRRLALALSTSVVLGTLAVPGTAFADAGPTALRVSGHEHRLGHLFVDDLKADSEVTGISAAVHPQGDDAAVGTVQNFQLASGDQRTGDWITTDEVRLPAAGQYAVDLVVEEADGDRTTLRNAGTYDYTAKRYFAEFGVDRPNPTIEEMKITAGGRLLEWQPVTHERRPVADSSVSIDNGSYTERVTTDADGRFSDWFIADQRPAQVRARHQSVFSETVQVTPKGVPARLRLDKAEHSGRYGAPVTISGTVEYETGGTWKPAHYADVTLVDAKGAYGGGGASTRDDGRFSFDTTFPAVGSVRRLEVTYGGWFSNKPSLPVTFRTTATSGFGGFTAELGLFSDLTVSGWLDVNGATPPYRDIDIQVSKNGKDGWTKLKTIRTTSSVFLATFPAPASGHYRAVYSGSATIAPSTSPVIRASRTETRIAAYKVTPTVVRKGGQLTATGTLQHRVGTVWKAYGAQPVRLYYTPKSRPKESYFIAQVKTAANGTFKKAYKERGDGTYFVKFQDPDATHIGSPAAKVVVDVK
ncbi:hypothetical protein [Streptomyces sp. NPDC050856]|uniref:hypothetical protein n=1 Tax=Streptomyces sp. NPDC050856 TaxID=3154939 RepID=UPI0033DC2F43